MEFRRLPLVVHYVCVCTWCFVIHPRRVVSRELVLSTIECRKVNYALVPDFTSSYE